MLTIAVTLALLLGLINVALKTTAAEDADHLTQLIAEHQGTIGWGRGGRGLPMENGRPRSGLTGTESPDLQASLRYFTAVVNAEGSAELIAYSIDSVTREEALTWAMSLTAERSTGWTAQTYRYRTWSANDLTFITVIDQGRELTGYSRALRISLIGYILTLAVSLAVLLLASKRLYQPLTDADRERSRVLEAIDQNYRVPLTVMSAGLDNLESRVGSSDETQLMRRQLVRMMNEVRCLVPAADAPAGPVSLSAIAKAAAETQQPAFDARGVALRVSCEEIPDFKTDPVTLGHALEELLRNARQYALSEARLDVRRESGRVLIEMSNDADLPDGACDQVFDRGVRLGNAEALPGAGLGLNRVREQVRSLNGRVSAWVKDGRFTVRISL